MARPILDEKAQSPWAAAFLVLVAVLVAGGVTLAVSEEAWAFAVAAVDAVRQPIVDFYKWLTPKSMHGLVEKAAGIFLSPFLYLLMLIVFVAEKWIPVDRRQPVLSAGFWQDFIAWFAFDGLVRTLVVATFVAVVERIYTNHLSFLTLMSGDQWMLPASWGLSDGWAMAPRIVAALLLGDFLHWFHHWLRHEVRVFWLFHTIHHSQRHMNMFTDLRVHLVEHLIAKPIYYLPLLMFGLHFEPILWVSLITTSYSRVYHANLRTNYGPLKYFMVTPQSHRVHHSILPQHMDKNFGVLFSVWDHLFGTQWKNYDEYPPTGISDAGFPLEERVGGLRIFTNYARQFVYPFPVLIRGLRGRGWELEPTAPQAVDSQATDADPQRESIGVRELV